MTECRVCAEPVTEDGPDLCDEHRCQAIVPTTARRCRGQASSVLGGLCGTHWHVAHRRRRRERNA